MVKISNDRVCQINRINAQQKQKMTTILCTCLVVDKRSRKRKRKWLSVSVYPRSKTVHLVLKKPTSNSSGMSTSNLNPRFCSFVHRHYCLNQPFFNKFLSPHPFNHLFWHPIGSLLQINKTDKKLPILLQVAFRHSPKNKNSVLCASARHESKLHLVNFH